MANAWLAISRYGSPAAGALHARVGNPLSPAWRERRGPASVLKRRARIGL